MNALDFSPIGQLLTQIFSITSDDDLEHHVSFLFPFNKEDTRRLKLKQPLLYKEMVEGKLIGRFELDTIEIIQKLETLILSSDKSKKEVKKLNKQREKYNKTISLNKENGRITFSSMYIDSINILLENVFSQPQKKSTGNRPFLKLQANIEVDLADGGLKDSLVNLNVIDKNIKITTLKNIFKSTDSTTKVNWLGTNTQLSLLLKLLKKMNKIDVSQIYTTGKHLFLIKGEEIETLISAKESDSKEYSRRIRQVIEKHFTIKNS